MLRVSLLSIVVVAGCAGAGSGGDTPDDCMPGTFKMCTTSDGKQGTQACSNGTWAACRTDCEAGTTRTCMAGAEPGKQSCVDGKWSDCRPDCQSGMTRSCTTAKNEAGTQMCANGAWSDCKAECESGTWGMCALPGGGMGARACVAGKWGECKRCRDGAKQACRTACGTGMEVCVNGTWENCDAPRVQQEVCDGVDNNCDGKVDEVCSCVHGRSEACFSGPMKARGVGACKDGSRSCAMGTWGACMNEALPAAKEDCTNAIDDDCNGTVNDGCACTLGATQECGSMVGECRKGKQSCVNLNGMVQWGECLGGVQPTPEVMSGCDGKDNDCNGIVDDGLPGDAAEANNDCMNARVVNLKDADAQATSFTYTIYPQGDVDYLKVVASETVVDLCCPWPFCDPPDPECNWLDVEVVQPQAMGGPTYEASILTGSCGTPSKTYSTTTKTTIQWDGKCGVPDDQTFWIKVEAAKMSMPAFACTPYTLKIRYRSASKKCS